ncbi:MAG: polyisoprenoid-binding protein [Chloroflexi bacterium]|nr:MAG: polyisoprenoid-binding protein [Chloroflexota bacterium]
MNLGLQAHVPKPRGGNQLGTWKFDPFHTQVEFSAKHLGMMTVRGHFAEVNATGEIHPDHPERTKVEATITTSSIRTHNEQRDKDLRSSNFLEIDKYPTMTFKSTKIEAAGQDRYKLTGDLTIKGTTKPVTLNVVKYGEFNDPQMGHRIGYAAETQINRKDFNMKFDAMLDGKFIVSNEIVINIEGEIVEAQEAAAAAASGSSDTAKR